MTDEQDKDEATDAGQAPGDEAAPSEPPAPGTGDGDGDGDAPSRPIIPPSDEQPIVFMSESGDHERPHVGAGNGNLGVSWPQPDALEPETPPRRRRPEAYDPIARVPHEAPEVLLPEPDLPADLVDPDVASPSLELRTPPEELEAFARARIEAWARVGQPARAQAVAEALELALAALRAAMGAGTREGA